MLKCGCIISVMIIYFVNIPVGLPLSMQCKLSILSEVISNLVTCGSLDEYKCTSINSHTKNGWFTMYGSKHIKLVVNFILTIFWNTWIYDTHPITNYNQVKSPFSLIFTYFTHAWKTILFIVILNFIFLLSDFKT